MNRRAFLRKIATVSGIGMMGGCLDSSAQGSDPQDATMNTSTTTDCHSFMPDVDTVICSDSGAGENIPVYLASSVQTFTVVTTDQAVETLDLTLHNQSDHPFVVNPGAWVILRRTSNDWHESAAGDQFEQSITVAPGDSHTWSLSLTPHPTPYTEETTFITENFEEGTYIFAIAGQLEGDEQSRRIECHTQFDLIKTETSQTTSN